MKYKVSVIIPVYNTEQYIERCARSLFNQKFENIEYIFVNDCTKDSSINRLKAVLEEYPERAEHTKICVHEMNRGLPAARNTGLSVAAGEYVIHCDSDDWMEDTMIPAMYNCIASADADIVWSDYYASYVGHDEKVVQQFDENPLPCMKALLTEQMHGAVWNKMVKRSLYVENNVRFPEGVSMWEDLRTTFRLFSYAQKVVYCPRVFYHYTLYNQGSLSNNLPAAKLDELLTNCDGIITFIKERCLDKVLAVEAEILKLAAKQILLFTLDKSNFKRWREIYPEANKYIWKHTSLPFHLRFIGWCAYRRLWIMVDLWIFLKKLKNRKK
ncbi:glycosyltransferase family 2 protein [Bacteroides congonensis]